MKQYHGIVFDLFATLALWHPDRLPKFTWEGKTSPSTMGELRHTVNDLVTEASFEDFYSAFMIVNQEHAMQRAEHNREIPSRTRFATTLHRIGYPQSEKTDDIAESLSLRHMELLLAVVEIPAVYKTLLESLAERFKLGLISNFDHGPTAKRILERDGIDAVFQTVVISDGHGWRKPHRQIFTDTLETLELEPQQTLFVGDSYEDDVDGASSIGMDVAWVNPKAKPIPADGPTPTFEINVVTDLTHILTDK